MLTCAELAQRIGAIGRRIDQLRKSGGHAEEIQTLLEEKQDLETQYEDQGCGPPPPPRLGFIRTVALAPLPTIAQGSAGDLEIEVVAANGSVDTEVTYAVEPPMDGVHQVGNWTVPIPSGESDQIPTLRIAIDADVPPGPLIVPIAENVFFGGQHDPRQQQFDYIEPSPVVTVLPAPPPPPANPFSWTLVTAFGIDRDGNGEVWHAGRVNDVLPLALDNVLAATDTGGLWLVSADGDGICVSDRWEHPNLNCLAVGPSGDTQIFAAGDGGLYVSNWTAPLPRVSWIPIPLPAGVGAIFAMVVDNASSTLVVATDHGVHSVLIPSSPSGPWSWTAVTGLPDGRYGGLALGPPGTVVTALWPDGPTPTPRITVLRFAGSQLNVVQNGGIAGVDESQMRLTTLTSSAADRNRIYAAAAGRSDRGDPKTDSYGHLLGVLRSNDGGATWQVCSTTMTTGLEGGDLITVASGQGNGWNNSVAASHVNPDVLMVGWRTSGPLLSTNGGVTWELRSDDKTSHHLHSDMHRTRFDPADPTGSRVLCCTDGGVAVTRDLSTTFDSRTNRRLADLQFSRVSASPIAPGMIAGCLQDNGVTWTQAAKQAGWNRVNGGDGLATEFLHTGELLFTIVGSEPELEAPHLVAWFPPNLGEVLGPVPVTVPKPGLPGNDQGLYDVVSSGSEFRHTVMSSVRRLGARNAAGQALMAFGGLFGDVYGLFGNDKGGQAHWEYLATVDVGTGTITALGSYDGGYVLVGTTEGRSFAVDGKSHDVMEIVVPARSAPTEMGRIRAGDSGHAWAIQGDHLLELGALEWRDVAGPWRGPLKALEVIPTAAGFVVVVCEESRVWASFDGGASWFDQSDGLPAMPHCTDLAVGPSFSDDRILYLASYGRSMWSTVVR